MSAFKAKLGVAIAVLIIVFFAAQIVYRKNVTLLHRYTLDVLTLSENLHTAEVFHSSMHSMIISAQLCARDKGEACKSYLMHRQDAVSALEKIERQTTRKYAGAMQGGAHSTHPAGKQIENVSKHYLSFQAVLDNLSRTCLAMEEAELQML